MSFLFSRKSLSRARSRACSWARFILLALEDAIIPPQCAQPDCGRRRFAGLPLCRTCMRVLRDARPEEDEVVTGLPWVRALFRLTPPLHTLIHGFKYRQQRRHIRFLSAFLRWRGLWTADLTVTYDVIVPVPLHAARRRERGYNQAEVLAYCLAGVAACPVGAHALRRIRFTGTQTRLGGRGRGRNLEGAFRADPGRVAGLRILLVDDVCTTGSTLSHCREALLEAGAVRVDALVLAWVERKNNEPPLPDFEIAAGFFA